MHDQLVSLGETKPNSKPNKPKWACLINQTRTELQYIIEPTKPN